MKKFKLIMLIISMSIVLLISGCEYNTEITNDHVVNNGGAYKEDVLEEVKTVSKDDKTDEENNVPPIVAEEKIPKVTKIMSIFNIVIETENLNEDIKLIEETIHDLKGYVRSHKTKDVTDKKYIKSADVIVRIPKDKASKFIEYIKVNFNAIAESSETIDITDTFFDLDLNIESLDKQEEQLLLMYERTNSIDDMLKISERLAEVSKEKKKLTVDYTSMEERLNYTTIEIVINEVSELSNTDLSLNERIDKSLSKTFKSTKQIYDNVVIFLVNYILLVIVIIILLIIYLKIKYNDKIKSYINSRKSNSKVHSVDKSKLNNKHKNKK